MRLRVWASSLGFILMLVAGTVAGVGLAFFAYVTPAQAATLTVAPVSIVSWRGLGDFVSHKPQVQWNGWSAPMFYTTPAEGAYPDDPEGKDPTGVWAPGDTRLRSLTVKNIDPENVMQLVGIDAVLRGDVELAPWFRVIVADPRNQVRYDGTLADLTTGAKTFGGDVGFLRMPGYSEEHLTFTVTLDRDCPWYLSGKTLQADFRIYAEADSAKP